MARLYEMCNDIDSEEILKYREDVTEEEKAEMIERFKEGKKHSVNNAVNRRRRAGRIAGFAAAAAAAVLVILPNTSAKAAYAMSQIPILGDVIKAVTIREYSYESERFQADIKEVQLEVDNSVAEGGQTSDTDQAANVNQSENMDRSVAAINEDIDTMTNRLIQRFEEQAATGESYGGVYMDHEVVTNTDKWFTLRLDVTEVAGSGAQYQYYYHIDKTTGEIASLKDLFKEGADYVTPVSENIKKQMRERMAEDDYLMYWVDEDPEMGFNFEKIKEDQNFYLNEKGQLVICFDEYEVAPGYMGLVEFAVEEDAIRDILK